MNTGLFSLREAEGHDDVLEPQPRTGRSQGTPLISARAPVAGWATLRLSRLPANADEIGGMNPDGSGGHVARVNFASAPTPAWADVCDSNVRGDLRVRVRFSEAVTVASTTANVSVAVDGKSCALFNLSPGTLPSDAFDFDCGSAGLDRRPHLEIPAPAPSGRSSSSEGQADRFSRRGAVSSTKNRLRNKNIFYDQSIRREPRPRPRNVRATRRPRARTAARTAARKSR